MKIDYCIFIGPEHCGEPARIIANAIDLLLKNGIPLTNELNIWLTQKKKIEEYKESLLSTSNHDHR